jgi:hypothetical protein
MVNLRVCRAIHAEALNDRLAVMKYDCPNWFSYTIGLYENGRLTLKSVNECIWETTCMNGYWTMESLFNMADENGSCQTTTVIKSMQGTGCTGSRTRHRMPSASEAVPTPRDIIILKKLIFSQLVKKSPPPLCNVGVHYHVHKITSLSTPQGFQTGHWNSVTVSHLIYLVLN